MITSKSYTGESETIDFYVDKKKYNTRARSHRYMDEDSDSEYTDSTYYDNDDRMLDIGYQHLRTVNLRQYQGYYNITKLYVDNNKLKSIPDSSYLPHLKKLNCSHNRLLFVPFYPGLRVLIANNNSILDLSSYNNSPIKFFDCSFNKGIDLNFNLPYCTNLFATNCSLTNINLNYYPSLLYLDCEHNKISTIQPSNILVELCINFNLIVDLPFYPNLTKLFASDNKLRRIITYPYVDVLNVKNNNIYVIDDQPSLKRLVANNNRIESIGHFPVVRHFDLAHNSIRSVVINRYVEEAFLYSNPLSELKIDQSSLKELHLGFDIYKHMMKERILEYVDIALTHNGLILKKIFEQLDDSVISDNMIEKMSKKMADIDFADRAYPLYTLAYCVYKKIGGTASVDDINEDEMFLRTHKLVEKMYLQSLVVVCYYKNYDKQN